MKKTTTIIFTILMAISLFGQVEEPSGVKYAKMDLFSPTWEQATKSYSADVTEGVIFDFDSQKALAFLESDPNQFSLELPTGKGGNTMTLILTRSKIFAPDFMVYTSDNGKTQFDYIGGLHYQGFVEGHEKSLAAISVFENEVMGLISTAEGNYNLGKLGDSEKAHILYLDKNLINPPDFDCYTEDDGFGYTSDQLTFSPENAGDCVRIYIEGDQSLFNNLGSAAAVTNVLTGVFNQSAVLYLNEGINIVISEIFVWTTPDPYIGPTSADYRNQFQANTGAFNGDLGHLVALDNVGGIAAGFAGICNADTDQSLCFSGFSGTGFNIVPIYSFNVFLVTHEMGHLFGSRHTHACVWNGNNTAIDGCAGYVEGTCPLPGNPAGGGTIMSYCSNTSVGVNFTLGFGPQPQAVILNSVANATCLSPCGTNTWTGAFNTYWHNAANWSLGHIPTAGEDVVITTAGSQPVRVNFYDETCDNLTIDPGVNFEIYGYSLGVAGTLDNNGTIKFLNAAANVTAVGFSNVGGTVQMTNGNFTVTELTDDGVYGTWNVNNGNIVLNQTTGFPDMNATLNMTGGTMLVSDPGSSCIWGYGATPSVTMSGGILDFNCTQMSITDISVSENITGGIIRTNNSLIISSPGFTPSGGTLELYGPNDATINAVAGSVYNLNINKNAVKSSIPLLETWEDRDGNTMMMAPLANSSYPTSTLNILGNLTITSGLFRLNGQTVTVNNILTVYGTLEMTNAADVLNVGLDPYDNLAFGNGSFGNLTSGVVNLASWVWIQPGGLLTATTGNTMNFIGPGVSGIDVEEAGTHLGNINVVAISPFRLYDIGGFPIEVDGNFNLQAGSNMDFQDRSMIVHGTFTDNPTSTMYIYDGPIAKGSDKSVSADITKNQNDKLGTENPGSEGAKGPKGGGFELDNAFTLNGLMDVGDGNVLIHGAFSIASTGTLNIDGGSVIDDSPNGTDLYHYLYGSFNITDGLFEITNNSINFGASATTNVSGGILRTGGAFYGSNPGTFMPTGGVVEVVGSAPDNVLACSNGNYFYDLLINRPIGVAGYFTVETVIQNDVTIQSGVLSPYNSDNIYVGGDWINNVGVSGFVPGTGTVIFNQDGGIQEVNGENTFYNVRQDLVGAGSNLQFMGPTTVLGNMTLNHFTWINDLFDVQGTLNLNNPASKFTANIGGMGTIANLSQGGTVVANGGTIDFLDLVEPGIYGIVNVDNGTLNYFQDALQFPDVNAAIDISGGVLNYTAGVAGCVIAYDGPASITMSGGEFNFINGYVGIYDGNPFSENITGGVISIDIWFAAQHTAFTPTGGTVRLNGGNDGGLSMTPGANFYNVEINKSGGKSTSLQYNDRFENLINGVKANTIGLGSDIDVIGDFTVNAGLFNMNNYTANVSGNTIVNTDGTLSVDAGGTLAMGSGSAINVNSGGTLLAVGVSGFPATVTAIGGTGYYDFWINDGGTMGAEYAIFEYMTINGVFLRPGSFVDPVYTFNYCTFQNGTIGYATLFNIATNQSFTSIGANFPDVSSSQFNTYKYFGSTGQTTFLDAVGALAGSEFEFDEPNGIHWTRVPYELDLQVFLEGPYNSVTNLMDIDLNNGGYIPLGQPYYPALPYYGNPAPVWLYPGFESVGTIPPNVVDWIVVQLRDASTPGGASSARILETRAGFVLNDGSVVDLDGVSNMVFDKAIFDNLFVVLYHRNHLGIMSNFGLIETAGVFSYNYSTGVNQVYGGTNGHKEIEPGVWGLMSGDGNGNGFIGQPDKINLWNIQAGETGYEAGDMNLNGQVNNPDKDEYWVPNFGSSSYIPE